MRTHLATLADVNICYQMPKFYTTDYVWQMRTRENGRTIDVHFDTVRLPRSMRVAYPRSSDELIEHWQQNGCFLIARNPSDDLIGFLDALPQPWQNLLWVSNFAVEPHHRQQGVATMLLKAAHGWALQHNLNQLMLELQTKNYPAISFAQKHGFHFCGYNERYYPNGDIALFFSRSV